MKDGMRFKLWPILSLVLALGGRFVEPPLTVSAQELQETIYLPILLNYASPRSITPTPIPTFGCAPQRLADIPVGYQPRGLAVDEART
jgi:hypothetical protein